MKLIPALFEFKRAEAFLGWIWCPLGFLLLVPVLGHTPLIPWKMDGFPLLERGVPIAWLLLAGAAAILFRISRASIPMALLIGWAVVRSAINNFPIRSIQILLLLSLVGLLYVAARQMDFPQVRIFTWVLAVGVGFELVLGWMNLFKVYPWMSWVVPDQMGRPMGLLTHPNYWGSLMAIAAPIMWALLGPLALIAIMIPIFLSY